MATKVTVQKEAFADSLAMVGRAVGSHSHLPILANVLLASDEGQLRLSATDLIVGITVWMDANMDGSLALTLPARTLTDVVNALSESEVQFSVNGKPEAALKSGCFKGVVKGNEASEFPSIPVFDVSQGIYFDASTLKEMIQSVAFAASVDDSRPVLAGVLLMLDEQTLAMAATDGFRLAVRKTDLPARVGKKQVIVPAAALKELARILGSTKCARVTLYMPPSGAQVVLRCENVQLVSQLIDGRFPDYQVIVPKSYKTRTVVARTELLKACKQAGIMARAGSNVVRFQLKPGSENTGKVIVLAEADETGESEIELDATVEGPELEIAFNVKFLQDALEAIETKTIVMETSTHKTPAVIHPAGEENYTYVLMPMHIDGK
jgi:DNA polymerase III subunit beta